MKALVAENRADLFSVVMSASYCGYYLANLVTCKESFKSDKQLLTQEICPGLNANEIQIPHDRHHKVSSL